MKKLIAFTLAEVIIVLGIVGIIAEMTIPGLIEETNKVQFTSGYKKAYTTWAQALSQMAMDTGCTGDLSCFFDSSDLTTMGDKITKYFKIAENCKITTDKKCWAKNEAYNYDGKNRVVSSVNTSSSYYKFKTRDGMSYSLSNSNSLSINCNNNYYATAANTNLAKTCAENLSLDVNGPKAPNTLGRDIFSFYITTGLSPTLYPRGGVEDLGSLWKNSCSTVSGKWGYACAGRIMEEGWQMNY